MIAQAQHVARVELERVAAIVFEVLLGIGLLLLFLLALAWDPIDRRLGLQARRRAGRLIDRALSDGEPATRPASAAGAYAIVPVGDKAPSV